MPKGKLLSREAKLRANGLLDMYYMPSELADELAIDQRDIYRKLLPAGLPHKKDAAGHIWLHGPEVAQWIQTLNTKPQPMDEHEGYCLKCRRVVPLVNPQHVQQGKFTLLQAICPHCGARVNRGIKRYIDDQSR